MSLFGDNSVKSEGKEAGNIKSEKKEKIKVKTQKIKDIEEEIIDYQNLKELKQISSFLDVEDKILEQFKNNRLHHTTMLSGNYGIGKATFAYWIISRMILSTCKDLENERNLKAMHIELLERNIHPDVFFLELQDGENEMKIEQIRTLLEKIAVKSTYGNKFIVIDDINSINKNGINAMLKTLEEPPVNTYFFLINHCTTKLLDTIYSRCHEIKMSFSRNDCLKVLQQMHEDWSFDEIEFYTDISNNSIKFANILAELGLKTIINNGGNNQNLSISQLLNVAYERIDTGCKTLSKVLKKTLLERIMMFILNKSIISDVETNNRCNLQVVRQNTQILKQFIDIKKFDLPVRFV